MRVADKLKKDPTSGQQFVFQNKGTNKIKILEIANKQYMTYLKKGECPKYESKEKVKSRFTKKKKI